MDQLATSDEGHRQSLSLGATIRDSLFRPRSFFESLDPLGALAPALIYALLFTLIAGLGFALEDYLSAAHGPSTFDLLDTWPWYWDLLDWPLVLAIELLYMAWLHLILRWRGGTTFPLRATLRAYCYGGAVNLFCLIPFLGIWISAFWGWWLVLFSVKTVQRCTWTRVITSWMISNALLGLLVFGVIFLTGYFRHYFQ